MRAKGLPFLLVLSMLGSAATSVAVQLPQRKPKSDLDVRLPDDEESKGAFRLRTATAAQVAAADKLKREVPGLTLRWDGMSGSPKWLAAPLGKSLSAPSKLPPESAARSFLRLRAPLLGLEAREIDQLELTSTVPAPYALARPRAT